MIQGPNITCNGDFALFLTSIGLAKIPQNGRTTILSAPKHPQTPTNTLKHTQTSPISLETPNIALIQGPTIDSSVSLRMMKGGCLDGNVESHSPSGTATTSTELDAIRVQFRSAYAGLCVPFALFNVVNIKGNPIGNITGKQRRKVLNAIAGRNCDLNDLATEVSTPTLQTMDHLTIKNLVDSVSGKFLAYGNLHCVGVDCVRRVIFDSEEDFALPLTMTSFHQCQIFEIELCCQVFK